MEDIINALLDVVRAQHTAAEGTDTAPFDMDDIVDMALNILGRPDGVEEQKKVIDDIEDMVHSLAPDIFPPKTFEQLDDQEKIQSAANMIEQSLRSGTVSRAGKVSIPRGTDIKAGLDTAGQEEAPYIDADQVAAYLHTEDQDKQEDEDEVFDPRQAADLNDLIYNNFMQMMGMKEPQVEYPFDRSQVRYGREKTMTEMLAEEEEAREKAEREERETRRKLSAWELAQNAVDKDEAAHQKEEYIPKPMEMPSTKSASQMAAEAIARSREEDNMKTEIERRAEMMMEEARKRGMDPMAFALHQQEILQYMEKNSDELVSFEDFEDLTPEEKYEIEQRMEEEKRREAEAESARAAADSVVESSDMREAAPALETGEEVAAPVGETDMTADDRSASGEDTPPLTEEMLLALSQEVLRENADMILAENADEDMESLNQVILENIRQMMAGSGVPVTQESVEELLDMVDKRYEETSAAAAAMEKPAEAEGVPAPAGNDSDLTAALASAFNPTASQDVTIGVGGGGQNQEAATSDAGPLSAAELAKAAQRAAGIKQPEDPVTTRSAAEIAREAQERSRKRIEEEEAEQAAGEAAAADNSMDMDTLTSELARAMEEMGGEMNEEQAIALLRQRLSAMDLDESQLNLSEDDLDMPDMDVPETTTEAEPAPESVGAALKDPEEKTSGDQGDLADDQEPGQEPGDIPEKTAKAEGFEIDREEELDLSDLDEDDLFSEFDDIGEEETRLTDAGKKADNVPVEKKEAEDPASTVTPEAEKTAADTDADGPEESQNMAGEGPGEADVTVEDEPAAGKTAGPGIPAGDQEEAVVSGDESVEDDSVKEESAIEADAKDVIPAEETAGEDAGAVEECKSSGEESIWEDMDEVDSYDDSSEYVLGEHTQAEIDEAVENLDTLGLEGEVYERAKYLLLLEMAGSEEILELWLKEQEDKEKKAAPRLEDEQIGDIEKLDEDLLEEELKEALEGDFGVSQDEETSGTDARDMVEPALEAESGEDSSGMSPVPEEVGEEREQEEADVVIVEDNDTVLSEDRDEDGKVEEPGATGGKKEEAGGTQARGRSRKDRHVVRKRDKAATGRDGQGDAAGKGFMDKKTDQTGDPVSASKEYQVSVKSPFVLKNSASFLDKFEEYIVDTQENRKLSTGFKKLDGMLRYGLHKGSYFIDAEPQYLKNGFMQQIADHSAESGVDVLYISTELSRYDLMVETISRLSYEIHGKDVTKAVSPMDIMTGENGADLASLKDELNWYRGRISEHLFILDQEAVEEFTMDMENVSAGVILEELIRSIVREGAHKPVVFIDNIENILSTEDSEAMKPLMEGIRGLARELGIPIIMSYGYAQAESEEHLYPEEKEFHESLGNMCDVYMELKYADMVTEDFEELSEDDILEMMEAGDTLLIDIFLKKNRRTMKASCQIESAPKFNFFEE